MTANRSLLAHLSRRLTDRTEDIAVEALGHILSSPASRQALQDILRSCGTDIGPIGRIETQSTGEGGERPDLAGYDEQGQERLLIEAKFWAGLTRNQPLTYLQRLPDDVPTALLVVAPSLRLETLWTELCHRVYEGVGISIGNEQTESEIRWADTGANRKLVLTSWMNMLGRMAALVNSAGEIQRANDIQQLQGLAEQEDTNAFLPLRPEQISPEFPRLLRHLYRLTDGAVGRLRETGLATTSGYQSTATRGYVIRYMTFCDVVNTSLGIYFGAWRTRPLSPIWLALPIGNATIFGILETLRQEPFHGHISGNHCYIPIYLRLGVEYESVLDSMVEQIERIAGLLKPKSD